MIKNASIHSITLYQIFISPFIVMVLGTGSGCRYGETCSMYTKRMISEKGAVRGIGLGAKRILSCQPITS